MKLDKSFFFHVFVCIFGLGGAQNTPFFEKLTNQSLRLNYAHLILRFPVHCYGQFNIDCDNIVLAFESFKVS